MAVVERRLRSPAVARSAEAGACADTRGKVLDAKRSMGGTRIEYRPRLVRADDRCDGNYWRDDDSRCRCCGQDNRREPCIENGRRKITCLMAEGGRVRLNTDACGTLMFVARRLGGRERAAVMAGHRARQLARRRHDRRPNEDQHEQACDCAGYHRNHRNTV
jgi:hypothetical protein